MSRRRRVVYSVFVYQLLLRVYPRGYRRRHGEAQTRAFRDLCTRTVVTGGTWTFIRFWLSTTRDLAMSGVAERLSALAWTRLDRRFEVRRPSVPRDVGTDIRYTVRSIRRRPGLAIAIVVTLAVGMGANLAVFTVVHSVLFEPIPLPGSNRLVAVQRVRPNGLIGQLGFPDVSYIAKESSTIEQIAGYSVSDSDVGGIAEPIRTEIATVTNEFFDVLRWRPQMGRAFRMGDTESADAVLVITDGMWRHRFGADPNIVGRTVTINDRGYNVVGVLSPDIVGYPTRDVEGFVLPRENFDHGSFWLSGIARLMPGRSVADVRAELDAFAARIASARPDIYDGRGFMAESLLESTVRSVRPLLMIFLASMSLLLVVASANVANFVLVRTGSRRQELTIRSAIGAGRARLVRQLVAESVFVALVAGVIGLVLAGWLTSALVTMAPDTLPRQSDIRVDGTIVLVGLLLATLVGVVLGLIASLSLPRHAGVTAGGHGLVTDRIRRSNVKDGLVVCQIALALVLVVGAGLLTKSFFSLVRVDPGFQDENLLSFRISLPRSLLPSRDDIASFHDNVRDRIVSVPGVIDAVSISLNPFNGGNLCNEVTVEGNPAADIPCAEFRSVSPGYFTLVGATLEVGRDVDGFDDDRSSPVAVINQSLARSGWPGESPLGRHFTIWDAVPNTEVIGVVSDLRQFGLDRPAVPEVYMHQRQFPFRYARYMVRTAGDPASIVDAVRDAVWSVNRDVPIAEVVTMRELVAQSVAEPRFRMLLMGGVALIAFVVSLVGVASMVSFAVTQRGSEIGVRMALGASGRTVIRETMQTGLRSAVIGTVLGILVASGVARVLERFLFGVEPLDWWVIGAATVVVLVACLAATYLPGRRASRIDPMMALRIE